MSDSEFFTGKIARSYAQSNHELVASFSRYMESRGLSEATIRSYRDSCSRFVDTLGSASIVEAGRSEIRVFLSGLLKKGLADNSTRLHTAALRAFWKFMRLAGLTRDDPTLMLSNRKLPGRLPRVLTLQEVEKLIGAAQDPFERAVPEVLYSTGVRVSELVQLRLENIDFGERIILVKDGKGRKDRYVLFGRRAGKAIRDYLDWRPSETFLFEAPARIGQVRFTRCGWNARFYADRVQHEIRIGTMREFPNAEAARREFDRVAAKFPGFEPVPARAYRVHAIRGVLKRLAHRAGLGRVHPHALRRAVACHMLSSGADLRAIQELLGHTNLSTTTIYTTLTAGELKAIHDRCHPRAQGDSTDAKED